ncbi:MAG: hypothetical protein WBQ58_01270 [Methanoregula sp.]|uniref:hypothetical protein n=1 Tax=Methanoregula sp. TaxID=2052170 RepID=UPI003BAE65B1
MLEGYIHPGTISLNRETVFKNREPSPGVKISRPPDRQKYQIASEAIRKTQQFVCVVKDSDMETIFREFCCETEYDTRNPQREKINPDRSESRFTLLKTWILKRMFPARS